MCGTSTIEYKKKMNYSQLKTKELQHIDAHVNSQKKSGKFDTNMITTVTTGEGTNMGEGLVLS